MNTPPALIGMLRKKLDASKAIHLKGTRNGVGGIEARRSKNEIGRATRIHTGYLGRAPPRRKGIRLTHRRRVGGIGSREKQEIEGETI